MAASEDLTNAWTAAGLYDPSSPSASDQFELLTWISSLGITIEQMVAAHAIGQLDSLPGDLALRPGPHKSLREIASLIGATRGFIRTPYVLEGAGLGALASLLTLLIVFPAYLQGITRLSGIVPFLELIREPAVVLQVLALLTVLGVGIGFLGSLFATNRYLREVE